MTKTPVENSIIKKKVKSETSFFKMKSSDICYTEAEVNELISRESKENRDKASEEIKKFYEVLDKKAL